MFPTIVATNHPDDFSHENVRNIYDLIKEVFKKDCAFDWLLPIGDDERSRKTIEVIQNIYGMRTTISEPLLSGVKKTDLTQEKILKAIALSMFEERGVNLAFIVGSPKIIELIAGKNAQGGIVRFHLDPEKFTICGKPETTHLPAEKTCFSENSKPIIDFKKSSVPHLAETSAN